VSFSHNNNNGSNESHILTIGHPLLRSTNETITEQQLLNENDVIHEQMKQLLHALTTFREKHGFGRGIASPQIGINRRMIAFHCEGLNNGKAFVMLNPLIVDPSK
jgi:peptide deformylase